MIGTKITRQNPDAMHLSFFPADFPPLKVIWGVLESLYSDYFFIFLENWRQPLKTWAMLLNPTPHVGLYGLCMIKIYHLWHMKFPAPITTIGFLKKKKTERSTRKVITQTRMKEEWLFWVADDEDRARLKVVFLHHSKARKQSRAIAFALYNYCGDH